MPLRSAVPASGPKPGPRPAPPRIPSPARAEIELVAATEAAAVEAADHVVDKLLDEGCAPADVLVITTGERHPWARHEMSFGEDAYWRQQTESTDVFCVAVSAVHRTVSRPIVVLAVNGGTEEQIAGVLPSVLERVGSRLIVCGDPERLRALL